MVERRRSSRSIPHTCDHGTTELYGDTLMKILSKEHISPTEVLNVLEDREDLGPQQRTALEHLQKHVQVEDEGTLDELIEELKELDTFTEAQIIKIIDVLPKTEPEVRTLFSKERIKLEDSDVDNIIDFSRSVREH